ncbi:hypothetical protein MOQ72_29335 [Saccharopolyspora sp. K220]|uniref:hypothetical protein n=1 Tax=Saccharopolyspora soli TaxID=2926618 RepID=UPI001F55DEE3|nr:hypothetical protein [Saccharopolyspora soli]MCI2421546.1 hypothetical protein [Saccharopolyspora soli]
MKIRITGTRAETQRAAADIKTMLHTFQSPVRYHVREVSDFYPNRGNSELGRVYLDVDIELPAVRSRGEQR